MAIYDQPNSLHSSMAEAWRSDTKFSFTKAAKTLLPNFFKEKFGGSWQLQERRNKGLEASFPQVAAT